MRTSIAFMNCCCALLVRGKRRLGGDSAAMLHAMHARPDRSRGGPLLPHLLQAAVWQRYRRGEVKRGDRRRRCAGLELQERDSTIERSFGSHRTTCEAWLPYLRTGTVAGWGGQSIRRASRARELCEPAHPTPKSCCLIYRILQCSRGRQSAHDCRRRQCGGINGSTTMSNRRTSAAAT